VLLTSLSILLISLVTCIGSLYARLFRRADGLIALYVLFVTLSQIVASKIAVFNLGFTSVTAPAAVLIFAVTFLITDIVNEKFGRVTVHHMVFLTWIMQIVMLIFIQLGGALEPAGFWDGQEAWNRLFGVLPRIILASWITFLISENLDAILFAVVRKVTGGRHLWARNVFSSAIALSVDSLVFCTLAFGWTDIPLWPIMKGQFLTKYLVCILNIPFMYLNRLLLGPRLVDERATRIS
jgi:hypothetical protein